MLHFWFFGGETINEEEMCIRSGGFLHLKEVNWRAQKYPEQKEVVIGKIPEAVWKRIPFVSEPSGRSCWVMPKSWSNQSTAGGNLISMGVKCSFMFIAVD